MATCAGIAQVPNIAGTCTGLDLLGIHAITSPGSDHRGGPKSWDVRVTAAKVQHR